MYRRFVADRIAPTLGTAHDGDIVRRVVRTAQTAKEKWRAIGHWPGRQQFWQFLGFIVFVTWNVCRTFFSVSVAIEDGFPARFPFVQVWEQLYAKEPCPGHVMTFLYIRCPLYS